jgi:tungstate transport system ATP-binding protein
MSDAVYHLKNVVHGYDGRSVLQIDELQIFKREILALVGPSGAGKSTLLRLLNFLETPLQGTIEYRGCPFNATNDMPLAQRREVTTVFQRPLLLNRSVQDNVAYGLRLRGLNGKHHITAALEKVGLVAMAKQEAKTLSGGEAQRVSLARATVLQPEVLLLDEPTANLDPYNVSVIEAIVKRLNQEAQTTMVLVTHNVFQARRLAHRVAFLLDGQIVEVGDKERFFDAPRDARTAAFVRGEMVY